MKLLKIIFLLVLFINFLLVMQFIYIRRLPSYKGILLTWENNTRISYIIDSGGARQVPIQNTSGHISWSPNGKALVFVSSSNGSKSDIYLFTPNKGTQKLVINMLGIESLPVWSPNHQWIVFLTNRDGLPSLYRIRPDGSNLQFLTKIPSIHSLIWSPDSRRIAYEIYKPESTAIYLFDADSVSVEILAPNGYQPSFSPDSNQIVFAAPDEKSISQVYARDFNSDIIQQLTYGPLPCFSPKWSPDGTKIGFAASVNGKMALYQMNEDGSGREMVTGGFRSVDWINWSSDSKWILFGAQMGNDKWAVYRVRSRGDDLEKISSEYDIISDLRWLFIKDKDWNPWWLLGFGSMPLVLKLVQKTMSLYKPSSRSISSGRVLSFGKMSSARR